MADSTAHLRWKILPDEEVTSAKADAFGVHTAYAKLLQRVASDCPTPFAVGLYSTWGSGKTSIIRLLQEIVDEDGQSTLTLVYLDVWKYSSDPLKRWILLETERQLTNHGLLKGYKFQGRTMQSHLEFEESLEDKDRIEIDFKNFKLLTGVIVLGIVLCGLTWIYVPATGRFLEIFRWLVALSAGGGMVALIVSAALKKIGESLSGLIFRRTVRQVTAKPAFSSEKFNEIFRDLVSQATNGGKKRRLVFVFDNLDRCPADVAVDVIGVVKTFLDEPGCVYVIPCDEQAILTHIKTTFLRESDSEASDFYANQFLTKFFQMTLRLPPAADYAVEDYLGRQLKEAGMEDLSTDARDVLILGYRGETPRQVKRVLNDLIAYRGIAEQIEAEKLVEIGALTTDLGHLTKMAVLSVKWPSFMRRLADDPLLWTDVMQRVRSQPDSGIENISTDLQQFLWNTRFVSTEVDIRPWLYLRRGTLEKDAPLNRRIEESLQNGAWKALLDLLNDEAMKDKRHEVLQIVSSIVRRWQNSNRRVLLRNGGPVLLKASLTIPDDIELRKDALDVLDYLASNASPEELEQLFDVKDILSITRDAMAWQRNKLLTKYAELFQTRYPATEGRTEIWKQLLQHGDLLDFRDKASISGDLVNRNATQPAGEGDVLSLLDFAGHDVGKMGWAVTATLLNTISARITFDESDIDKKRLDSIVSFRRTAGTVAINTLLDKIASMIDPTRIVVADAGAKEAVSTLKRFEPDTVNSDRLKPIISALMTQANRSSVPIRAVWLGGLIHLYPDFTEASMAEMDALCKNTFVDADPNQTLTLASALNTVSRKKLLAMERFSSVVRNQSASYQARFTTAASEFRKQFLGTFEAVDVLRQPAIFDESFSWDLALYIETVSRAVEEKAISNQEAGSYVEAFCSKYLPATFASQKELYASLLLFLQKHSEASRVGLAEIVATCELSSILAANYASYPNFLRFKEQLPSNRRYELVREVLSTLSSRTASWVQLLVLVLNDVRDDKELSKNLGLIGDLADYAFAAAREKWVDVGETLTNSVALLDEAAQQDYVDRSLEALLALEADGEDLAKMEPFLDLVAVCAEHVSGSVANKGTKFVQRMIGAGRPDPAKLRILQFASRLTSEVLSPLKQSIEQLTESTNTEVSLEAKAILGRLAPPNS
jgi:hypothetical protein